ncbi:MAG: hypothetical protein IRZ33_02355, partial [Alicyclobacillaceae bacterium]|nr:hypothetical protein [Alicyclobacillaceae bacterium]
MLKQRNRNSVAILTFESVIGSGVFEWIPSWLDQARTAVWIPLMIYAAVAVMLSQVIAGLARRLDSHQTRGVTVFDSLFQNRMVQLTLNGLLVV